MALYVYRHYIRIEFLDSAFVCLTCHPSLNKHMRSIWIRGASRKFSGLFCSLVQKKGGMEKCIALQLQYTFCKTSSTCKQVCSLHLIQKECLSLILFLYKMSNMDSWKTGNGFAKPDFNSLIVQRHLS